MNGLTEQDCAKMIFWSVIIILIGVLVDQVSVAVVGLIGFLAGLAVLWRME